MRKRINGYNGSETVEPATKIELIKRFVSDPFNLFNPLPADASHFDHQAAILNYLYSRLRELLSGGVIANA